METGEPTFRLTRDNAPSIPPNITWPVVWYRFAKDMPHSLSIMGGVVVAIVIIIRIPEAVWPAVTVAGSPFLLSVLGRSRPDHER